MYGLAHRTNDTHRGLRRLFLDSNLENINQAPSNLEAPVWVFSNLEPRSPEKLLKKEANQILKSNTI